MGQLRLEVRDFEGPLRWRWLLSEEGSGAPLADHQVDLADAPGEFAAFTDLYRYLRWNAAPDRRTTSETEIAGRVGAWAAKAVLGQRVCEAVVAAAPVTVRVVVPERAGFVLSWPLELAHSGGRPLAARGDVTFAYDLAPDPAGTGPRGGPGAAPVERGLRMLAVFSLPTTTSVLALRRERYALARLVRRIAARQRRRVELTVVQYGATRQRLAAVAEAGDGWDVLHLSGHGGRGQFLLEKPDGSPDPVDTGELVGLLAPLRGLVRLAVVSACESAAATTAETLRWVGLEEQAQHYEQQAETDAGVPASAGVRAEPVMTGLARAVAGRLGCGVVAMRYPVVDDFAIAFAEELYERLLGVRDAGPGSRGQPLGTALARAVARAAGPEPTPARPVLSLATPVLLGTQAGLVLQVPREQLELDLAEVRMEAFPPEPERFVGRAQAMASASAVLAPGSSLAGVLLHGMAGSGKTACALELAYRYQDSFAAAAFWQAPLTDDEFGGALASLASQLEIQLGEFGFAMADKITTIESLTRFTPRLRRLLEDNGILLVLDNLETLLTGAGAWRDPRWEPLMAALTGHGGESRVILTSRIPPTGLADSVLTLPVHALDLAESVALARELPGLRGLLHADASPERDADAAVVTADRNLVRRVLHIVQGHPKLMELADAAATDVARLAAQLDAAETTAGGQILDTFFRDGTTILDAAQFLDALDAWTTTTLGQFSTQTRLMAQFLACLEDNDRNTWVIDVNWADLWRRLSQPGDPPDPAPLLAMLTSAALIQPEPSHREDRDSPEPAIYRMHPGVAQAIHATAPDVQAATDTELASTWQQVSNQASQQESGEAGQAIIQAGLAAVPYLLRLQDWNTAAFLLERALLRDESPATIQAALPALRAIANATQVPETVGLLARGLASIDPAEAKKLLRGALSQAVADKNFRLASSAAQTLSNLLIDMGSLRAALDLSGQMAQYSRRAGLGPWTQLSDQVHQLRILGLMGQHQQVLDQLQELRDQMEKLPLIKASNETIAPWSVREAIFDIGRSSTQALEEWQQCLDFSAAARASKRARKASDYEIISFRYNDARPLIELGRLADAERILLECQQVYEDQNDIARLTQVLSTRSFMEHRRGRLQQAMELQRTAIRFAYVQPVPRNIAIVHHQFAAYFTEADPTTARAHLLAAALLYRLSGMNHLLDSAIRLLASELHQEAGREDLPGTVDEVIRMAEQIEGVRLNQLITALEPERQALADILAEIIRTAADTDPRQEPAIEDHLQQWEPVIAATVAAVDGDSDAAAQLAQLLDQMAQASNLAALAAALRRIIGGDRDDSLLRDLDPTDTYIAAQILTRLAQPPDTPAQEDS